MWGYCPCDSDGWEYGLELGGSQGFELGCPLCSGGFFGGGGVEFDPFAFGFF